MAPPTLKELTGKHFTKESAPVGYVNDLTLDGTKLLDQEKSCTDLAGADFLTNGNLLDLVHVIPTQDGGKEEIVLSAINDEGQDEFHPPSGTTVLGFDKSRWYDTLYSTQKFLYRVPQGNGNGVDTEERLKICHAGTGRQIKAYAYRTNDILDRTREEVRQNCGLFSPRTRPGLILDTKDFVTLVHDTPLSVGEYCPKPVGREGKRYQLVMSATNIPQVQFLIDRLNDKTIQIGSVIAATTIAGQETTNSVALGLLEAIRPELEDRARAAASQDLALKQFEKSIEQFEKQFNQALKQFEQQLAVMAQQFWIGLLVGAGVGVLTTGLMLLAQWRTTVRMERFQKQAQQDMEKFQEKMLEKQMGGDSDKFKDILTKRFTQIDPTKSFPRPENTDRVTVDVAARVSARALGVGRVRSAVVVAPPGWGKGMVIGLLATRNPQADFHSTTGEELIGGTGIRGDIPAIQVSAKKELTIPDGQRAKVGIIDEAHTIITLKTSETQGNRAQFFLEAFKAALAGTDPAVNGTMVLVLFTTPDEWATIEELATERPSMTPDQRTDARNLRALLKRFQVIRAEARDEANMRQFLDNDLAAKNAGVFTGSLSVDNDARDLLSRAALSDKEGEGYIPRTAIDDILPVCIEKVGQNGSGRINITKTVVEEVLKSDFKVIARRLGLDTGEAAPVADDATGSEDSEAELYALTTLMHLAIADVMDGQGVSDQDGLFASTVGLLRHQRALSPEQEDYATKVAIQLALRDRVRDFDNKPALVKARLFQESYDAWMAPTNAIARHQGSFRLQSGDGTNLLIEAHVDRVLQRERVKIEAEIKQRLEMFEAEPARQARSRRRKFGL